MTERDVFEDQFHNAASSSGAPSLFRYLTGDISASQMAYFTHWDRLLDMEHKASEQAMHHRSAQHGVWTDPRNRGVFTVLSTDSTIGEVDGQPAPIHKHMWTMRHRLGSGSALPFAANDRLSLSVEKIPNHSLPSLSGGDIEDIGRDCASVETWNVLKVEPHVATGVVVAVQEDTIHIGFSKLSSRLQR